MSSINILNIRQADGLNEAIAELKYLFEKKINLDKYSVDKQNITLSNNKIMRICLLAGLSSMRASFSSGYFSLSIISIVNYVLYDYI